MDYGHVCFAYSKNEWIAKAIAWFTRSKWSHSFITVPKILNKEMVMEAASGGTEMITFDQGYRNNPNQSYEIYRLKVDPATIDKGILKCLDNLEMPYGFLQYPWFMWRSLNRLFGRDIKKQDNWSQKNEVCSGLVESFLWGCDLDSLFADFGSNSVTAQDVYNIVLAHPELFELIEKKD